MLIAAHSLTQPAAFRGVHTKWIWREFVFKETRGPHPFCGAYWFVESLLCSTLWLKVTEGVASRQDRWVSMGGTELSGQIHFSPLLKWIFPSCQRVKSGFSETHADFSLTVGFLSPIGSISLVALPPSARYSGFPAGPEPAQPWQTVRFSLSGTH